jgi:hypothetical protein
MAHGKPPNCKIAILEAFFYTRVLLTLASWEFALYYTVQRLVVITANEDRSQMVGVTLVAVISDLT